MTATPETTVTAAFAAFERGDWRAVVALLDQPSLEMFRELRLGSAAAMHDISRDPQLATGGGSLTAISSADHVVKTHGSVRLEFMPGSPTVRDLASLSPQDFYVRWHEASSRVPFALRAYGWITRFSHWHPERGAAPTVIGSVGEGDDITHVLYRRQDMQYDESARVDLITLRRDEGGWRLELNAFGMRSPLDDGDIMLAWRAVFWRSVLHAFKAWLKRVIGRARAQQP